ncbi:MAG: TolC family protein [Candidatus Omnitrophica bacterium]|nr:TolC family protein [Candidatus Omnitrophota bacterium]
MTTTSEDSAVPSPGTSYDPLAPSDIPFVPAVIAVAPVQPAPASTPVAEPVAVRKDAAPAKIEIMDKKEQKKQSKYEKAEDKARTEALEKAVEQQVDSLRAEREQEMPYLDKVYIRTSITPLKIQQKEEFLSGGAKDLQELILRAQSVHTQAKAAHENIALYHRRMLLAFRKLFPEADLNMNGRIGTAVESPYTGKDWHVTLRQPIFNGGVLWNTLLQEKANLEAANKQYDKTLAELVFDISRAYFEYQRTLQTAEEHRTTVEKMKRFAEMSEEKFKEKIISEIERLNVQSLYSQMQFDLESANQELEIAKLDLQKYLDLSENDQFSLAKIYDLNAVIEGQAIPAGSAVGAKTLPDVFKGEDKAPELSKLIDLSYGHRPELQVEAAKLQAARLGERIRWGEFLPKANLTYKFGALGEAYTAAGAAQIPEGPGYKTDPQLKKEWQLMLEMNWNVGGNKVNYTYDRNITTATIGSYGQSDGQWIRKNGLTIGVLDGLDAFVNVKQAEVDKLNQVVELEKAEKQVLQDVKQAYYDYQKSTIQVNSTVKRLEYRKRLRDFSEHRLSKKEIELSEYLQAESDLVREKAELHKALKEYFSAKAALNHAVGIQNFFNMETSQAK